MNAHENPAAVLAEAERVGNRTRLDLRSSWYPMVVTGAAALGAAAVAGLAERWVGLYWLAAIAASFVATGRYYRARALRLGAQAGGRIYLRLWIGSLAALVVAGSVAGTIGGDRATLAAQCAVLGGLYLILGRLQASLVLGVIGVATIALGAALAGANAPHEAALANLCLGAALVVGGLVELSRDERP